MNIEKTYQPGDDFVVLKITCPPLPERRVSVSVDALAEGLLTIEGEIERETLEAEKRLERHRVVESMVNGD